MTLQRSLVCPQRVWLERCLEDQHRCAQQRPELGDERPQALFESLVADERVVQHERNDLCGQEHERAAQHKSPEPTRPRRAGKGEARQEERDVDPETHPLVRVVMPGECARGFARLAHGTDRR
jgi:hypothetical protein